MKKKPRAPSAPATASRQRRIMESMLASVPFDGWSEAAYARALDDAGVTRGAADLLLPQGVRDLIELFGDDADKAMERRIKEEPGFRNFRVREKIAFALRARLEALTPHREAARRMLMWYALPPRLPLGVKRIAKTADLMWRAAGDGSTDFNYYTKRILLAAVVKATTLYWLDDQTPGQRASWEFLDRRISEVLKLGKSISLLKEFKPAEVVDFVRRKTGFGKRAS